MRLFIFIIIIIIIIIIGSYSSLESIVFGHPIINWSLDHCLADSCYLGTSYRKRDSLRILIAPETKILKMATQTKKRRRNALSPESQASSLQENENGPSSAVIMSPSFLLPPAKAGGVNKIVFVSLFDLACHVCLKSTSAVLQGYIF